MSAQTIHKSQKVSKADVVFNIILYGICGLILLLIAYPLYFIIIASLVTLLKCLTARVVLAQPVHAGRI